MGGTWPSELETCRFQQNFLVFVFNGFLMGFESWKAMIDWYSLILIDIDWYLKCFFILNCFFCNRHRTFYRFQLHHVRLFVINMLLMWSRNRLFHMPRFCGGFTKKPPTKNCPARLGGTRLRFTGALKGSNLPPERLLRGPIAVSGFRKICSICKVMMISKHPKIRLSWSNPSNPSC